MLRDVTPKNHVICHKSLAFIKLTQSKWAIIDRVDLPCVVDYRWYAHKHQHVYYADTAVRYNNGKKLHKSMHRILLPTARLVDHANGNGLDNRRGNLRPCSYAENRYNSRLSSNNSSGTKGVTWHKHKQRWQATLQFAGKTIFLGYHDSVAAAAVAYALGANKYCGKFTANRR